MCEQYLDQWTSKSILYKVIASASLSVGVCETLDQWTSQTIVRAESLSSLEMCV